MEKFWQTYTYKKKKKTFFIKFFIWFTKSNVYQSSMCM